MTNVTKPNSKDKRKEGRIDAFEQPNLCHLLFEESVAYLCSTSSQITTKLDKKNQPILLGGLKLSFSHWSVDVYIHI